MFNNIKIIVSNIVEDEKHANGLWDMAEMIEYESQEDIYNFLLDYAIYTHPDHYSNKAKVEQQHEYSLLLADRDFLLNENKRLEKLLNKK